MSLAHLVRSYFPSWGKATTEVKNTPIPEGLVPFGSPIFTPDALDDLTIRYCKQCDRNPDEWYISRICLFPWVMQPNSLTLVVHTTIQQVLGSEVAMHTKQILQRWPDSTAYFVNHHSSDTKNLLGSIAGALRMQEDANRILLQIERSVGRLSVVACPYFKSNLGALKLTDVNGLLAQTLRSILINDKQAAPAPPSPALASGEGGSSSLESELTKVVATGDIDLVLVQVTMSTHKSVQRGRHAPKVASREQEEKPEPTPVQEPVPPQTAAELVGGIHLFTTTELEELSQKFEGQYEGWQIHKIELVVYTHITNTLSMGVSIAFRKGDNFKREWKPLLFCRQGKVEFRPKNRYYGYWGDRVLTVIGENLQPSSSIGRRRVILEMDSTGRTKINRHIIDVIWNAGLHHQFKHYLAKDVIRPIIWEKTAKENKFGRLGDDIPSVSHTSVPAPQEQRLPESSSLSAPDAFRKAVAANVQSYQSSMKGSHGAVLTGDSSIPQIEVPSDVRKIVEQSMRRVEIPGLLTELPVDIVSVGYEPPSYLDLATELPGLCPSQAMYLAVLDEVEKLTRKPEPKASAKLDAMFAERLPLCDYPPGQFISIVSEETNCEAKKAIESLMVPTGAACAPILTWHDRLHIGQLHKLKDWEVSLIGRKLTDKIFLGILLESEEGCFGHWIGEEPPPHGNVNLTPQMASQGIHIRPELQNGPQTEIGRTLLAELHSRFLRRDTAFSASRGPIYIYSCSEGSESLRPWAKTALAAFDPNVVRSSLNLFLMNGLNKPLNTLAWSRW